MCGKRWLANPGGLTAKKPQFAQGPVGHAGARLYLVRVQTGKFEERGCLSLVAAINEHLGEVAGGFGHFD